MAEWLQLISRTPTAEVRVRPSSYNLTLQLSRLLTLTASSVWQDCRQPTNYADFGGWYCPNPAFHNYHLGAWQPATLSICVKQLVSEAFSACQQTCWVAGRLEVWLRWHATPIQTNYTSCTAV